jgi:hypothetical protein
MIDSIFENQVTWIGFLEEDIDTLDKNSNPKKRITIWGLSLENGHRDTIFSIIIVW